MLNIKGDIDHLAKPGDIVTRGDGDEQRIDFIDERADNIHVTCILAAGCFKVGDREFNTCGRYRFIREGKHPDKDHNPVKPTIEEAAAALFQPKRKFFIYFGVEHRVAVVMAAFDQHVAYKYRSGGVNVYKVRTRFEAYIDHVAIDLIKTKGQ